MRQNACNTLLASQFVPFMYDFVTCNELVTALLLLNAILDDTVISVQNHTIPVHNRSILHQYYSVGFVVCGRGAYGFACTYAMKERSSEMGIQSCQLEN